MDMHTAETTQSPSPRHSPRASRPERVQPSHLERSAIVYVRQSTPQQVEQHRESREVQYSLRECAIQMGWLEAQVVVIDDDLGKSGASVEGRLGFQRLVTEVSLNHVGLILGMDMSRLARSCSDWYRLLELCAVFGTLIGDFDGVYDPAQYNDRLLLGLKGTMSEAELHIIKQRSARGRLNKASRGEFIVGVPIGYLYRPGGKVSLDPDEGVRDVVRLIFRKFEELGSLHKTLGYLVAERIQLPVRVRSGPDKGELEWHRPNHATLYSMFRNPIYAGAYAYGKRAVDPRRRRPNHPGSGRRLLAPEECQVFLKDRFPAYISWEEFEAHRERLRQNRSRKDAIGAPRQGESLLAGLLFCGKCGRRMRVQYQGTTIRHYYLCSDQLHHYGQACCQSISGAALDRFVSGQALRALAPASVDLSMEAAERIEARRQEMDHVWRSRVERATYEADLAGRHYHHIEPENRLVARELAREWEEKMLTQRNLQSEHETFLRSQPRTLGAAERETIRALAADIPALWAASTTTAADRKEILRQVIDRITVDAVDKSEHVRLRIEWAGGTITEHETTRPVAAWEHSDRWPLLAQRVRELVEEGRRKHDIARILDEEGWEPITGKRPFGVNRVHNIAERLGLMPTLAKARWCDPFQLRESEWWLSALAAKLEMPKMTLSSWAREGRVRARQGEGGRWILWADATELERLRSLRKELFALSHHSAPRSSDQTSPGSHPDVIH